MVDSILDRVGAEIPPETDIWTLRQSWPGIVHWIELAYALGRADAKDAE